MKTLSNYLLELEDVISEEVQRPGWRSPGIVSSNPHKNALGTEGKEPCSLLSLFPQKYIL